MKIKIKINKYLNTIVLFTLYDNGLADPRALLSTKTIQTYWCPGFR
jgi:hypothetical protein